MRKFFPALVAAMVFVLADAIPPTPQSTAELTQKPALVAQDAALNSTNTSSISTKTYSNPCASVSALAATQTEDTIEVPAQLAHDCLQLVPLDAKNATRLVNSFEIFFQFQSTTAYNKKPPSSYHMPAIDALATLNRIRFNITSGAYHGEYDFQVALYKLVLAIHDDHLGYTPDLVADTFSFTRAISLVSFSVDGSSLPKLYVVSDLASTDPNVTNISAVTSINGEEASYYLEKLSFYETGQDLDTNYNRLVMTLAANGTGSFSRSKLFDGANTTLQFENGTTTLFENHASVKASFSRIQSPEALYAQVCQEKVLETDDSNPGNSSDSADKRSLGARNLKQANGTSAKQKPQPPLFGYPHPIVRESQNVITGYHMNDTYSDIAVLAINGFSNGKEFQSVVSDFLARSQQASKTKLIIDIQSNGGGDEDPEYDMFGQLFPSRRVYEASAWRASSAFKAISQTMDELRQSEASLSDADKALLTTTTPDHESFNFREELTVNFTNFKSFDQYFGPFQFNGDNFTSAAQTNLSTPAGGRQQGIDITGYSRKANISTAVFQPKNIIVLTNGDCSSMCASLVEQTRIEVGLKFVAVGGRPKYGQMEIAGGTHGGGILGMTDLSNTVSRLQSLLAPTPDKQHAFNAAIGNWDTYAISRAGNGSDPSINNRNTYRHNDTSGLPTQFRFDPADCRLFYTREDMTNMTNLWTRVADVAFRGKPCSSTGNAVGNEISGVESRV